MASDLEVVKIEWTGYCETLLSGIWRCFDNQLLVDTSLTCQQQGLKVHRLILAVFFPGLEDSLNEDVNRGSIPAELCLDYVTSDDRRGDVLTYLMQFAYSGKVDIPKDRLTDVLHAAELMGCERGLAASIRAHQEHLLTEAETTGNSDDTSVARELIDSNSTATAGKAATSVIPKRAKRKGFPVKLAVFPDNPDIPSSCGESSAATIVESSQHVDDDSLQEDLLTNRPHETGAGFSNSVRIVSQDGASEADDASKDDETKVALEQRQQRVRDTKMGKERGRFPQRKRTRKMLSCQHCEYTTRDKATMDNHAAKRHDAKLNVQRFTCEFCSKGFCTRNGYRFHMTMHSSPEQRFKCEHCPFSSPQKWTWRHHLAIRHKVDDMGRPLEENMKCSQCEFACVTSQQLRAHVLRHHTLDKPFKCKLCPYMAVTRSDVAKHVSVQHRKERDFMCDTCGFRSQTRGGLNRHKRGHLGIKPFKCELCGKEYADRKKLRSHVQRHTSDEKPFVCHVCGHACRRQDNLQVHLRRVHGARLGSAEAATVDDCVVSEPLVSTEVFGNVQEQLQML